MVRFYFDFWQKKLRSSQLSGMVTPERKNSQAKGGIFSQFAPFHNVKTSCFDIFYGHLSILCANPLI